MGSLKQKAIALALLSVLAALPIGGTVCVALCTPSAVSASAHGIHHGSHHGSRSSDCHESSSPAQPALSGASGHDCLSHTATIQASSEALTAGRADAIAITLSQDLPVSLLAAPLTSYREHSGSGPPAGIASPTRLLVLRI